MNKRRIVLLIVGIVFLAYLAAIAPHASYVMRESYRVTRGTVEQYQDKAWLDEAFVTARAAADEGETKFDAAYRLVEEARTDIIAGRDSGEIDYETVLPLLDEAEEIDPDNSLINYVRAYAFLDSPGQSVWKEKALAEVEAGNRKARFDTYGWRNSDRVREKAERDLQLPALLAVTAAMDNPANLRALSAIREMARRAAYAAEHHLRAGEPEKAIRYARLSFGMADKLYENESTYLIPIFIGHAIELLALGVGEQAATELGDTEAREEARRRGLGTQLWFAPVSQKIRAGELSWPMALWSIAAIVTACFAIFCVVYLFFGTLARLVIRAIHGTDDRPAGDSVSMGLVILLAIVGPLAAVIAYVVTLIVSSATSGWGGFIEGFGLSQLGFWLALPSVSAPKALLVAVGAYVVIVCLATPLVVRRTLWQQLVWGASLISLYNPFSRGEAARACRRIFACSLLPAGLVLAGILIISFWPVSLAMQRAVNGAAAGDAPLLEEFGRPPKALDAESYKTEAAKLARQLKSDDVEVARMAVLGLERGLVYERIPELISALSKQKDEGVVGQIWRALYRLAREVQPKPLEPYLVTAEGKPNWDAAIVLARSQTPGARYLMGKLHSALSGGEMAWREEPLDVLLRKLEASIREGAEPEKMERFASALAEGGHPDLAMLVVKRVEATEAGIQGFSLRALAYVNTDEALEVYRRYLKKSGFQYEWDTWPSTLEFLDEDLAEWILREHIEEKKSLGYDEFELAQFVSRRMVPLLLEGLDPAQPPWTRTFCIERLGEVGDDSVVPALLQVLFEEPPSPSPTPTAVPGEYEDLEFFLLEPQEPWAVRVSAARALGEIGSPSARPGLQIALEDPSEQVRGAARWALEQLPE